MKKLLSLFLVLLMVGAALADVPEYVNTASEYPVIADGYTKTYSVVVNSTDEFGYSDDVWFWEFCRQALNINFEVEHCYDLSTRISTAFASKNMPDAFFGCGFTTDQLVNYGQTEHQLVDIKPYIDEELMPNLSAMLAKDPTLLDQVTAPDGCLYSLPFISSIAVDSPANRSANCDIRFYINKAWLDELGLAEPETLDDFIDAMYAFKDLGDDIVPIGGSANAYNPSTFIYASLGCITNDGWGVSQCLRNGKVTIPAGDKEVYTEYVTLMHQLWEDGIIEKDFFTLDTTTCNGKMSLNQYGMFGQVAYLFLPDSSADWSAVGPLTADIHDKKEWPVRGVISEDGTSISTVKVGAFVVTTACEDIEGLLRFADLFFDANSKNINLEVYGPSAEMVADGYGYGITEGWEMDETTRTWKYVANASSTDNYPTQCAKIFGIHAGSIWGNSSFVPTGMQIIAGYETDPTILGSTLDPLNGDDQYRITNIEHYYPYLANGYPTITFFDAATTLRISDLKLVITDWVKQETAKFVTGTRSLDTLDEYFAELDALGYQELLEIYTDYYENMK